MVPVCAPDLEELFGSSRKADVVRTFFFYLHGRWMMMLSNENFAPGVDRKSGWRPVIGHDLQLLMGNDYKRYIDTLMSIGVLERNDKPDGKKSYVVGELSMLYRIQFGTHVGAKDRKYREEYITDHRCIGRISRFFHDDYRKQRLRFLRYHRWFTPNLRFIDKLYLSDDAVQYALSKGKDADKLLGQIEQFNLGMGRFIKQDDFAGRIHHHVAVLNKNLRPFLKVRGSDEPLVIADVNCAQPYLLSALLYHKLIELLPEFDAASRTISLYQSEPDTRLFFEHCAKGEFYPRWIKITGKKKKVAKGELFRDVFYSAADNHHKDYHAREVRMKNRLLFQSMYPSVMDALTDLKRISKEDLPLVYRLTKRKGKRGRMYAVVAMLAQRLESKIFLDRITKRLAAKHIPVATIHDAWIMTKKDQEAFQKVFDSVFQELGITPPTLEIDELKPEDNSIEP